MALFSIIFITLLFVLRKSNKKRLICFLLISWIVSLIIIGVLIGIQTAETYVAGERVHTGYAWFDRYTGKKISDIYETVGGQGMHPVLTSIVAVFSFGLISVGLGYGLSILTSRKKSIRSKIITTIIFISLIIVFFVPGFSSVVAVLIIIALTSLLFRR